MNKETRNIYLYSATGIIFAIGFATYSALGSFGGTLASIDRSLASIERSLAPVNKMLTPYENRLKDGCYQLFGSAVLDRPGCYVLQEDVRIEKKTNFLVYIKSSDVTVDLNKKTVTGPGPTSLQSGIYIESGDNVKVRNGTIRDFMFGIRAEKGIDNEPLESVYIENVNVIDASIIGIKMDVEAAFLRDNRVVRTADNGEEKEFNYLFDVLVESEDCYYRAAEQQTTSDSGQETPLIRLPEKCTIAR